MKRLPKNIFLVSVALGAVFAITSLTAPDYMEKAVVSPVKDIIPSIVATLIPETGKAEPGTQYIEVTGGCGPYFETECLNVRKGAGIEYDIVSRLRNGIVLKAEKTLGSDGKTWYKIIFDEWLRFPERITGEWYVSGEYVRPFLNKGPEEMLDDAHATTSKRIIIDRSDQKLYAYDGKKLFMKENISTGLELTPTPRGIFHIYRKTPSRYMQGPIDGISEKIYDLPGVPWNLYFTEEGAVIHGAYWHDKFGEPWSNGCVNLPTEKAKTLYDWAELGTEVLVQD